MCIRDRCVTSEEGTKAMAEDMGFVIPFKSAPVSYTHLNGEEDSLTYLYRLD